MKALDAGAAPLAMPSGIRARVALWLQSKMRLRMENKYLAARVAALELHEIELFQMLEMARRENRAAAHDHECWRQAEERKSLAWRRTAADAIGWLMDALEEPRSRSTEKRAAAAMRRDEALAQGLKTIEELLPAHLRPRSHDPIRAEARDLVSAAISAALGEPA